MTKLQEVCQYLESFAPLRLAEEWDNVGLLVGDRWQSVAKVMTCLTVTPSSVAEAIEEKVDLIVAHHPLPFRATKRVTTDSTVGKMLWELIGNGIAIYSPHTAFDSAAAGINQQLATAMQLESIEPLRPIEDDPENLGSGRLGQLSNSETIPTIADRLKNFLQVDNLRITGDIDGSIKKVAVGCGSGGEFLAAAKRAGCDMFVTGEATFHTCLEAEANQLTLLLVGHYASERFAVQQLATQLATDFPDLTVWASRREHDPLRVV